MLKQFDYVFAIAMIFGFLDAFMIGANDVANSWATSVSSRSVTLRQAMILATIFEFAGAIGVGGRVADTIRTKVVSTSLYEGDASVLMVGMTCALVSSSIYLSVATRLGMPVSTTHSIMGGVIGMGIATVGASRVNWGWEGVAQVFAAWAIAPGISGISYGVLKRENPVRAAFFMVPVYFAFTTGILTMLIVWKGASSLKDSSNAVIIGSVLGVAFGVAFLVIIFLLPYLHRLLIKEDWELKWYHVFYGPLLLKRGDVPPKPEDHEIVTNYYTTFEYGQNQPDGTTAPVSETTAEDVEKDGSKTGSIQKNIEVPTDAAEKPKTNIFQKAKNALFHGVDQDVVTHQALKSSFLVGDLKSVHDAATHFDNKAEHTYSFLQVLTASTSSFAHGANDVSNAVGPLASVYVIWQSANEIEKKSDVPIWILAYCGAAISIGLWFYGYQMMRQLGNRITLHSPSRGFSMELGSACTVVMATRLALPISTTQCISGATVGVGLCAGTWRAINWRMIAWIYFGWIITLPVTGIISGCLTGILINSPQWGKAVVVS
ncbi:Na+/Pi symporter [Pseudogymnoascus australis]